MSLPPIVSRAAGRALRVAFATAGLVAASVAYSATPPSTAAVDSLTVGLHYVAPPFVGGTKVRTPESLDADLAQALAARLGKSVRAVTSNGMSPAGEDDDRPDWMVYAVDADAIPTSSVAVPTGYVLRPMAIMRTDTDIKQWRQLRGRTVCVSEGSPYVGSLAAQYGAVEVVHRAPADGLLALRTGGCDAAVHDETLLKALLKLPEWKKFSASLPPGPALPLSFVLPESDTESIAQARALVREWKAKGTLRELNRKRVQEIAFEVYLDQVVEDCH